MLRLRGDLTRDIELTDRVQVPQVAELLLIDAQWYRVAEIQRAYRLDAQGKVAGWDVAARLTATNVAQDMHGSDYPQQMELGSG